jgi:hypothetical protein
MMMDQVIKPPHPPILITVYPPEFFSIWDDRHVAVVKRRAAEAAEKIILKKRIEYNERINRENERNLTLDEEVEEQEVDV